MTPTTVTEPGAVAYQAVRDTDLTTKRGQQTYLMDQCGVDRNQARLLITAYQRDLADAARIGNNTGRDDTAFLEWLLVQTPGGRKPRSVPKREWRVKS